VAVIALDGIAQEIQGIWSLWQISITSLEPRVAGKDHSPVAAEPGPMSRRTRIMPLFVADSGEVYGLTARHIWDRLLVASPDVRINQDQDLSQDILSRMQKIAEDQGKPIYEMLVAEHRASLDREREKTQYAFYARRRAIERIGLPQVRDYRLSLIDQEERSVMYELDQKAHVSPELFPIIVARIVGNRE
jgi:hypothetical protein